MLAVDRRHIQCGTSGPTEKRLVTMTLNHCCTFVIVPPTYKEKTNGDANNKH